MQRRSNKSVLAEIIKNTRGLTPTQIAREMQLAGIKGRPATTTCCPLANLLQQGVGGKIYIGQKYLMRVSGGTVAKVKTPQNLATFQREFDHGRWPELILPPPRITRKTGHTFGMKKETPKRTGPPRVRRAFFFAKQVGRI